MAIRFVFSNGTNVSLVWNVSTSGGGPPVASGVVSGMSNVSGTLSSGQPYSATLFPLTQSGTVPAFRSPRFTGDTEITFSITATPL